MTCIKKKNKIKKASTEKIVPIISRSFSSDDERMMGREDQMK